MVGAALCLGACGSATHTVSVERDTTTVVQRTAAPAAPHTTTVVQAPATTTTVIQAPPSSSPVPVAQPGLRACDQNISASQDASCPLAENVFYELWEQANTAPLANTDHTVTAYSPVSQRSFTFDCSADSESVECVSETDANDEVTFSIGAFDQYTPSNAAAYASTHNVG
jgi:hypothetical protein